ncbi:MAG: GNAT family N-acetyltransferase [Bacteroidia bacterium]|nr:GNAT family N-acetyltransferase [Bacteroidia bacterium]
MIEIVPADSDKRIEQIKLLFTEYAAIRNYDAALGNFQAELESLPGKYAPPAGSLLLALYEQQVAGCIAYQPLETGVCEMKRMFVSPVFRGKGIGTSLIKRLVEIAVIAGYHTMRLDTHPWMFSAHKLYQAEGFYEIARYNQNPTPGIRFYEKIMGGSSTAPDP